MAQNPPNQTLYLRNLNEKIKVEELKKSLLAMFSQFGPVADVVAYKTLKMRGQAFVVFRDIASATAAMRQLQGFPFYDKPMTIQYALSKSFATAKDDGTYEDVKRKRDEDRAREKAEGRPRKKAAAKAEAEEEPTPVAGWGYGCHDAQPAPPPSAELLPEELLLPPNNILFLQNIPPEMSGQAQSTLTALFKQYNGFKEVRLVPGKWDIAFVEFDADYSAAIAKDALQSFALTPTHMLKITFAKR